MEASFDSGIQLILEVNHSVASFGIQAQAKDVVTTGQQGVFHTEYDLLSLGRVQSGQK